MKVQTVLALLAPTASLAMSSFQWRFTKNTVKSVPQITFPFQIVAAAHDKQWYFASQYGFTNKAMGYCGIQPQADGPNGQSRIRGVFSSFTAGTTTDDPNCSDGADGGPGVSCGFVFDHDYTRALNIVVEKVSGDKWAGKAVDTTTGKQTHIGSWTLPRGSGDIDLNGHSNFVERYLNNEQPCEKIPRIDVKFFNPISNVTGAGTSSLSGVKEYDFCKGKKNFKATPFNGGLQISMGF
ncbi:hypothetical protein VFPPC_16927 [Pochonia chlamydosporia 170]|uniref:Uncharacterized protein n=1 Tax=Pochonia chlamydosporia 170 TaxID=1380566 RepID=A0A179F0Y7_METCM|nr:hypothetical protein VFPPC_16927 [Pochonia chlamydosporia 170]OAQ58809.1 hypothetical protein VFPPC_16927 [Pochonia chlamydosporia 170]